MEWSVLGYTDLFWECEIPFWGSKFFRIHVLKNLPSLDHDPIEICVLFALLIQIGMISLKLWLWPSQAPPNWAHSRNVDSEWNRSRAVRQRGHKSNVSGKWCLQHDLKPLSSLLGLAPDPLGEPPKHGTASGRY